MKPYDKADNDTYVELYSHNMAQDVEIHMFKSDKGRVSSKTLLGTVMGDFSVESRLTSQNNVFHFETAKNLNLKNIKSRDIQTLIPLSLMKRYSKTLNDYTLTHKTPIFFDTDSEKFVFSLDKRFLRDLKEYSYFKKMLDILVYQKHVSIVESNNEEQLLFNYDSLDDLYEDKTKAFAKVKEIYLNTLLNIYPSEQVIIIAYNFSENKENYFKSAQQFSKGIVHEFANSNIQFEFVTARKITDTYFYLYNEHGTLNTSQHFHFDKDKRRKLADEQDKYAFMFGKSSDFIIMPYTEHDFQILVSLKDSIDSIFKDLDTLLLSQKTTAPLDSPISQIESNSHFLLSDNSKSKHQLK